MEQWVVSTSHEPSPFLHRRLWVLAFLFFVLGDLITTGVGLGFSGVSESNPVPALLVERYGLVALLVLKSLVFCGYGLLWKLLPAPYDAFVPLALALLGVSVTSWNLYVLAIVVVL